jgi:hypothetical protein
VLTYSGWKVKNMCLPTLVRRVGICADLQWQEDVGYVLTYSG